MTTTSPPARAGAAPIGDIVEQLRNTVATPYYLIDESRLMPNLERIALLRERSGAKSVLALKCFSTWSVFDLMRPYLDGTTSSSLYEARLGAERFGKEVHAYSVAFSDEEFDQVRACATKIIFNSASQLERFRTRAGDVPIGLRINPGVSYSRYTLADPARPHSRLGETDRTAIERVAPELTGVMFHCNCENEDLDAFRSILETIGRRFGSLLSAVEWVSLGGGISFTRPGYPFDAFAQSLADFAARFDVDVYLEPGDAVVAGAGFLVARVLDVVHNGADIAIVDAGVEPHMLDMLVYDIEAKLEADRPSGDGYRYTVAGRTCLAGDVFGTYHFPEPLRVGSLVTFGESAAYTIVKKNWFNGLPMPSIVVRRLNGDIDVVRRFGFDDFVNAL
ncbi:MAG TPA: carboxynorspermidine decarboxylase [Gemmatimonadaceae bacterium]|jgi:carboxynorspermidine decarboxylase|nr:carboxynorspermidine decarboxylase [Gemmatimonadaceae bacterium]